MKNQNNYIEWQREVREAINKLRTITLDIDDIKVHGVNNVEEWKVKGLVEDIQKNGQTTPVYVEKEDGWWLKDGKHRYNALKKLGIKEIKVKDITEVSKKYEL